jgi:hypothetical protein
MKNSYTVPNKQKKKMSHCIQHVHIMGTKPKEATLQDCEQDEMAGILTLMNMHAHLQRGVCQASNLHTHPPYFCMEIKTGKSEKKKDGYMPHITTKNKNCF